MSLLLDGLILICAIWCIVSGVKKGFIRSAMGLVKGIVSLLAAWAYTPVVQERIKENYIIDRISAGIAETLRSLALNLETQTYDLSRIAKDLPEAYTAILTRYGIDIPSFSAKIAEVTQADEGIIAAYSAQIADPCATMVASAAAFAILFLGVYVALSLVAWFGDMLFHLPVLSEANHFAGLVFGCIEAAFFACVIASIGGSLVEALGPIDPTLFGPAAVQNSVLCKWILSQDLLTTLTGVLS